MIQLYRYRFVHKLAFIFILMIICNPIQAGTKAGKGYIDLSGWDFEKNGNIDLKGEWAFYWKKLLNPDDLKNNRIYPDFFIDQPRCWADATNTTVKPTEIGYATYRLKVKVPSKFGRENIMMGLAVKNYHLSCYVWINGVQISRSGIVTDNPATYKPTFKPFYDAFYLTSDTLDIVIQVANFMDSNQGGLDDNVVLGTYSQIKKRFDSITIMYVFSFSILLVMALYHLFLFLFNRKEKHNLYFMFTCLSLALMSLCIGERVMFTFFPDFPVTLFIKTWNSSVLCVGFMNIFLYYFFPGEIKKKTIQVISAFYILHTILAFALPISVYTKVINYFLIGVLITFIHIFYVIIKCVIKQKPHSIIVLIGMLIPLVVGTNDILFAMDVIVTGYYGPLGYLVYVLTQSIIISWKLSNSFKQVEILTIKLESANIQLENKVEERTKELAQANMELRGLVGTKDKFFSIVTHDLRNSFQALKNLSDHLVENFKRKEQNKNEELADWINRSAIQTNNLLENLVEWARIQSGKMAFSPEEFNLYNLIQDIFQIFTINSAQKKIFLKTSVAKDQMIFADYNMMQLILRNLVSNAIKFTEKGGLVRIDSEKIETNLRISITDTGIGIPSKNISTLFLVDKTYSTAGTENEKGTGLGLLLCNECVVKHGGSISIESKKGKGTTFNITLPIRNKI